MTSPDTTGPGLPDGHADDWLSAHLDGELDAPTAQLVEDHLGVCAACREALDQLAGTRSLLRTLPAMDGGPVVSGVLARHHRLLRIGAGFVLGSAVVLGAIGTTSAVQRRPVVPEVASMVAAHDAAAVGEMEGGMEQVELGDMLARPYSAPAGLIGSAVSLSRQAVYDGDDLTAVVYGDGDVVVSVFEQPGVLDRAGLVGGRRTTVAGEDAWERSGPSPTVFVAQRGDLVVTIVSDDRGAAVTALAGLPELTRRSTWDRVHDACQRVVQVFALGG